MTRSKMGCSDRECFKIIFAARAPKAIVVSCHVVAIEAVMRTKNRVYSDTHWESTATTVNFW